MRFQSKWLLLFCLSCFLWTAGCGKEETASIQIPHTEEEVIIMLDGEAQHRIYNRIQGNGDYTLAYDAEQFALELSEECLLLEALEYAGKEAASVRIQIENTTEETLDEVVDAVLQELGESYVMEEVPVGEGEYPALWIRNASGVQKDDHTYDAYILSHNGCVYQIELFGLEEARESLGEVQQLILSTLRFDEG